MAARRQGSRVEIMPDRTEYSQTFVNPDGTTTVVESARPRWVKRGSSWVDASADLVEEAGGSWSPEAAESGLSFSGGGRQALATITSGSHSIAVTWPSVLPEPVISGPTATYRNVFPGVDLVLRAQVTGAFDETLVIDDKAAVADPQLRDLEFGVSLSAGLVQHTEPNGAVEIETAKGGVVFTSPAPMAWDSSNPGAGLAGPGAGGKVSAVGAAYAAQSVRLTLPPGLASAKFPVYLDPSYTVTQSWVGYGEIQSAYPTAEELDDTPDGNVSVGYDGTGIDRGNYVFALPGTATGNGSAILSATMTGEVITTLTAASVSHTVNLDFTGQYTSTSTWDNPPSVYAGPVAQSFTTASLTPDVNVSWDVTGWLQADIDQDNWQFSAELINGNESTNSTGEENFVEFANDPTLSITYDHPPVTPSTIAMSPQYWASDGNLYTSSATPSFSATTTDPDGDDVEYQVEVLSGATVVASGTTGYVTSGTSASWSDTTALSDDTGYSYQVRAYDGTEWSGWSYNQPFTVETDTPAAVTISCAGYPSGTWSAQVTGGTTCSWNAPLTYMNGYIVTLDGGQSWTTGTSTTIDPGAGLHTLQVAPMSAAGLWGSTASYSFGVGATGAMTSPADGSQTSTTVSLQADAPPGYTGATFEYREGTTGSFEPIPDNVVYDCGCSVSWPVSTTANAAGVQTDDLTWYVTRTLADDGPVQIEAVFTDSSGDTDTTPPVTVTLDRIGTGADYGTTTAGPVTVGLQSGNAAVSATDVSIASYGADLTVTRTFNSVEPALQGIFGPGWATSLTGGETTPWTGLDDEDSYVVLQAADGSNDTFTEGSTSDGVTSWTPSGDTVTSGLTLTQDTTANTFTLTDSSGTVTVFGQSGSAAGYVPETITVPGDASSAGIVYDGSASDGTYGDPLLMVAPDAASSAASTTACPYPAAASTWTAGCRGLEFSYNSADDVSQISFVYVDNSGDFHDVPVADYGYDGTGRLTSEWDPRLSTPLVTGYTYDETASDADYGRITQISPAQAAGSDALAPWTLTYDDTSGDVNYGKILTVSRTHSDTYGGGTATTTIDYSVPLTTADDGPVDMDAGTVANWGQTDAPVSAVAIFPASHVPSSPPTASDYQYATIDYYDASGRQVNTASYINGAWAVNTTQYDAYGNTVSTLTAADLATALASSDPAATAYELSSVNVYGCDDFGTVSACTSSDQDYEVLTDSYGPAHTADVDGTDEVIRTHTAYTYDAGAPNGDSSASGDPYMLVTSQTTSASIGDGIPGSATADARTTSYTYGTTAASWALGEPLTTVTDPDGLDITQTSVYNTNPDLYGGDALLTDTDMPSDTSGGGAGDTQTVYYTAGTNPIVAACGNEPEWANLTCQAGPAAQPGTTGLPDLPVTTYTYDDYLNVTTETQNFGSTGARVTTTTYDSDERPVTQTITVSGTGMGTAVPETQTVYSPDTGLPTDTQTLSASGAVTGDINTTYDDFGQELTYTDASGNTTTYTYDLDGRVISRDDGEGTETMSYTGSFEDPTQIADSQAGTFTATYNPDGNMVTETYPGDITGTYSYDPTGTATSVSYDGTDWTAPLTDTVTPDAAGDWATQSITDTATGLVSSQDYIYDNDDRLTSVQDTEAGQCTTRAYTYDADSNRLSLTTYAPNSDGTCQDSTGTTTTETYDSADRATNAGYAYDTQGDITTTPSADAGGSGLTATYYANDMLASQTQNGGSMTWTLDPTLGRYATYTQNGVTYTNHYSDTTDNPTWTSGSDGSWTRNVTDFNGNLAAEVTASGVTLELPDLHGDIMATATTSTTAVGPAATYVYTEFGTPEVGTPGTYEWLGADQISSNALGGQLLMGARAYNTNAGRFSQIDPVPGGSANAYDYAAQNPETHSDVSGLFWLFNFYHWSGHIAFEFTSAQAREMAQGYLWGAAGVIGGLCSMALEGWAAPLCMGVVGVIVGVLSQAVSGWWTYSRREIVFSYGWHWTWWFGYPYFEHQVSYTWW